MMHITAKLTSRRPADDQPDALVTGVYPTRLAARRSLDADDPRAAEETVLPVTWSRSSRRPRVGETLPTTREASGLVAVVLPQ